jgi:hypothetical protein
MRAVTLAKIRLGISVISDNTGGSGGNVLLDLSVRIDIGQLPCANPNVRYNPLNMQACAQKS